MDFRNGIFLLLPFAATFAAPASDPEKKQFQRLQVNGKQQISQLQAEWKEADTDTAIQLTPQISGNPSKTEASLASAVRGEVDPHLAQVDSQNGNPAMAFVEGGMGQEEYVPQPESRKFDYQPMKKAVKWQPMKKAVGWQPMKKAVKWQPMKKAVGWQPIKKAVKWQPMKKAVGWQPMKKAVKWQPMKRDEEGAVLQAVEQHQIEDLMAAQKNEIEPQQILADLHEWNVAQ